MISEASTPQVSESCASGATAAPTPSFIELSDEEILSWLSLSILDEHDPTAADDGALDEGADDFWERVARMEAELGSLGVVGDDAVAQAIGLVGVGISMGENGHDAIVPSLLGTESALGETRADPSWVSTAPQPTSIQAELVNRAQKAVAIWASLQGSALRAACNERG